MISRVPPAFIFFGAFFFFSCATSVEKKMILFQAEGINRTDGVSPNEAITLAQAFVIKDADLCGARTDLIEISNPDVINIPRAYQVVFDWKNQKSISGVYPIIIAVDKQSGEVHCVVQGLDE